MEKLTGLLGKLEEVRDAFKHHLDGVVADPTMPSPGEDRPRLVEMLKESVGSFTSTLERFR